MTHPSDLSPPEPPPRRGITMPAWLACLILLLVVGGLGYGAWWLFRPPPAVNLADYEPAPGGNRRLFGPPGNRGPRGPGFNLPPQTAETVVLGRKGNGSARVPGLQLGFTSPGGQSAINDLTPRRLDPADAQAARLRLAALNGPAARRAALGITDAQIEELRKTVMPDPYAFTADQRATLLKAWKAVQTAAAAARPAAEKSLLETMKGVAHARTQTAAAAHVAADRVRAVLTPEQIANLQAPPAKPASRPATTRAG